MTLLKKDQMFPFVPRHTEQYRFIADIPFWQWR